MVGACTNACVPVQKPPPANAIGGSIPLQLSVTGSPALEFDHDNFVRCTEKVAYVRLPIHVQSRKAMIASYTFMTTESLQPCCLDFVTVKMIRES